MIKLTKPLLEAMAAALDAALAGEGFDGGDFCGMEASHFERARKWVAQELDKRSPVGVAANADTARRCHDYPEIPEYWAPRRVQWVWA
jgi:hypothetical protein